VRIRPRAGGRAAEPNPRLALTYLRLTDPERFGQLAGDAAALASAVPGAAGGDIAYVTDGFDVAACTYLADVAAREQPAETAVASWGGLALAARQLDPDDLGSRALRDSPEVVRAVYREIRQLSKAAPDLLELAAWLSASGALPAEIVP
jgi:hypothetical protein